MISKSTLEPTCWEPMNAPIFRCSLSAFSPPPPSRLVFATQRRPRMPEQMRRRRKIRKVAHVDARCGRNNEPYHGGVTRLKRKQMTAFVIPHLLRGALQPSRSAFDTLYSSPPDSSCVWPLLPPPRCCLFSPTGGTGRLLRKRTLLCPPPHIHVTFTSARSRSDFIV